MHDIVVCKKKLSDCLGEGMNMYIQNLKAWFKQKISKEDFDMEARRMFKPEQAHIHNEFLLALFQKCQNFSAPPTAPVSKQTVHSPQVEKPNFLYRNLKSPFVPVNPLDYAPHVTGKPSASDITLNFCSREQTLPDSLFIQGHIYVISWENSLEDVGDGIAPLIVQAAEFHLKNILSTVIAHCVSYRLREKRFRYAHGAPVSNPYLHQASFLNDSSDICLSKDSLPLSILTPEESELDAVRQVACSTQLPSTRLPISLLDLFNSLQLHRSTIPSHTIYATNMERIVHKFWHQPSNDDEHSQQPLESQKNSKNTTFSNTKRTRYSRAKIKNILKSYTAYN